MVNTVPTVLNHFYEGDSPRTVFSVSHVFQSVREYFKSSSEMSWAHLYESKLANIKRDLPYKRY